MPRVSAMTLALLEQHERDRVRVRVGRCDCADPSCDARVLTAQLVDGLEDLWVAVCVCEPDEVDGQVEFLLADETHGQQSVSDVLEAALPLIGLTYPLLSASVAAVAEQMTAWAKVPDWMERVPLDTLWSVRSCVFGGDLSRVPNALRALHAYYVSDSPAHRAWRDA